MKNVMTKLSSDHPTLKFLFDVPENKMHFLHGKQDNEVHKLFPQSTPQIHLPAL